jgi:hypothetical protein
MAAATCRLFVRTRILPFWPVGSQVVKGMERASCRASSKPLMMSLFMLEL